MAVFKLSGPMAPSATPSRHLDMMTTSSGTRMCVMHVCAYASLSLSCVSWKTPHTCMRAMCVCMPCVCVCFPVSLLRVSWSFWACLGEA